PPAAGAAIEAIPGKKVMIIGGFDRQLPLEDMASAINKNADELRKVLLIGESAGRLADALRDSGFNNYQLSDAKTMQEIVETARELAHKGDAVVLSPGFPSFDMFKDFEERGNQFVKAVGAL
ncbi:MAG TPA: hypothetical protein VFM05_06635, partial [Candidatus Saccharimonadales bacterium]|nr:hypothetical protein [Candidatus Saccharimonadales bacterium]